MANQSFEDEIKQAIEEYLKMDMFNIHTNLSIKDFKHIMLGDYYILELYGGLNGRGQFLFYMEDVSNLVKMLMIRFNQVWLIKWENDCPDDVFTISLGMRF
jgi:hypothetical protein